MGLTEFCALTSPTSYEVAAQTFLVADILRTGRRNGIGESGSPSPVPFGWQFGVCGVGVQIFEPDNELRTAIFTKEFPSGAIAPFGASETLGRVLVSFLGRVPDWLSRVILVGVIPPVPQFSPGDRITATNPGSAGCQVHWPHHKGFLSVGHVSGPVGTPVYESGQQVGTVVYANDPTNHGTQPESDVALIDLDPTIAFQSSLANSVALGANASLYVVTSGGKTLSNVRSYSLFQFSPTLQGTWGNVYATTSVITQGGDSGAPVVDKNNALVGHVVGEFPIYGTIIQDVHYQLADISRQPQFSGISI
jgi:hypothetical protein